jgi:antitoxin (DNA-binding transcriptional repressor) of toxin-antitoxin stability system
MGTAANSGVVSKRPTGKRKIRADAAKVATVTVGELRSNFKAVEAKLAKGLRVQVTRRGEVVAEVVPVVAREGEVEQASDGKNDFARHIPEMMARMREIWGDKPVDINTTALISETRDRDFLS